MKSKFKKFLCVFSCAALLTGTGLSASAAQMNAALADVPYSVNNNQSNITTSGPLTIESHLNARAGYGEAYYKVLIYGPSDAVGVRINDMPILNGSSVVLNGAVKQVAGSTYESITVKVTLFYEDKAPYTSYETIYVSTWCGVDHERNSNCF